MKLIGKEHDATYFVTQQAKFVCIVSLRLWESLALGVLPVIERGVGLEKTVSNS